MVTIFHPLSLRCLLAATIFSTSSMTYAAPDSPIGLWLAADANDDAVKSVISITEKQGILSGTILKLIDKNGNEVNITCRQCHASIDGKPLKGLTFITGLRSNGSRWSGGRVFDIRPGWKIVKEAQCEIFVNQNRLHFIGRVGIFSQESIWIPYEESDIRSLAGDSR
jgi:uncharacterized protein (DUF2147 family)